MKNKNGKKIKKIKIKIQSHHYLQENIFTITIHFFG